MNMKEFRFLLPTATLSVEWCIALVTLVAVLIALVTVGGTLLNPSLSVGV
ncbi:MAG: hypothetical protein Q7U38_12400 [Methylobacter sp.]|nr:hypothetical protein [Methylobacter sp.]MDP2098437.1 hypothetical protein [Methylobacter sp.]MDP2427478.1 hypothetical protein [Methylobacter sp.]MDP3055068.1 hypothetical protein [Methylobacter sp.]MDP3361443.1 hypothetical protein [Methylobacter sp.]